MQTSTCGRSQYYFGSNEPGIGIVGGVSVEPNEYPWIVRLFEYVNSMSKPSTFSLITQFIQVNILFILLSIVIIIIIIIAISQVALKNVLRQRLKKSIF